MDIKPPELPPEQQDLPRNGGNAFNWKPSLGNVALVILGVVLGILGQRYDAKFNRPKLHYGVSGRITTYNRWTENSQMASLAIIYDVNRKCITRASADSRDHIEQGDTLRWALADFIITLENHGRSDAKGIRVTIKGSNWFNKPQVTGSPAVINPRLVSLGLGPDSVPIAIFDIDEVRGKRGVLIIRESWDGSPEKIFTRHAPMSVGPITAANVDNHDVTDQYLALARAMQIERAVTGADSNTVFFPGMTGRVGSYGRMEAFWPGQPNKFYGQPMCPN